MINVRDCREEKIRFALCKTWEKIMTLVWRWGIKATHKKYCILQRNMVRRMHSCQGSAKMINFRDLPRGKNPVCIVRNRGKNHDHDACLASGIRATHKNIVFYKGI